MIDKKRLVKEKIRKLEKDGRLGDTKKFVQHGNKSVYDHVLRVTVTSLDLSERLHITVDEDSLIRGALLHDYFLYDWHEKDKSHSLHGFKHPKTSLKNAMEDFELNEIEKDIISHHMFPLTLVPPHHREAWIVSMADKIVASKETVAPYKKKIGIGRNYHKLR